LGICQSSICHRRISLKSEMSVIIILLSASLTIATGFLVAFIWSVKSGQYDDAYTPSVRILFDDTITTDKTENINNKIETEIK
jgi:cbb3-type cytochrome oxidase maturation protein